MDQVYEHYRPTARGVAYFDHEGKRLFESRGIAALVHLAKGYLVMHGSLLAVQERYRAILEHAHAHPDNHEAVDDLLLVTGDALTVQDMNGLLANRENVRALCVRLQCASSWQTAKWMARWFQSSVR